MPNLKRAARNKLPKQLAVIDADNCTGCEACVEVCPVDCIVKVRQYDDAPGLQSWCEIDWDRCIGCKLCIRVPGKKSDPYTLTVCPWKAIEMVPVGQLVEAVERMGGPTDLASENRDRLLAAARRQQDPRRRLGNGVQGDAGGVSTRMRETKSVRQSSSRR